MRRLLVILLLVAGVTTAVRGAVPCGLLQLQPDCYVTLHPGPTRNTFEAVSITGEQVTSSTGSLLLTTVAVDGRLDLVEWVRGVVSPRIGQVPRRVIYPPGENQQDVAEQNAVLMESSQLDAAVAALRQLDYDIDEHFDGAEILEISSPTALDGDRVEPGDVIVGLDGETTTTSREVAEAIGGREPGETVPLRIRDASADGGIRTVEVELIENPDEPGEPLLGVVLTSALDLPVDVDIDTDGIGGPSAGLMFALTVVDLLEPADLTGGRAVAGTGTITREGSVGAIGGITQKILGAMSRDEGAGAEVFLVPEGNMAAARSAPVDDDILLVPVGTLGDAVEALRRLRDDRAPRDALALSPGGVATSPELSGP